jgi:hypothetical protein
MNIALIEKWSEGLKLSVYDENLTLLESDCFDDSNTLNFHLQTLAKKHRMQKGLLVFHNKDKNAVELSLAQDETSLFVS